eukprot:297144-Amphidinium_carterae.1
MLEEKPYTQMQARRLQYYPSNFSYIYYIHNSPGRINISRAISLSSRGSFDYVHLSVTSLVQSGTWLKRIGPEAARQIHFILKLGVGREVFWSEDSEEALSQGWDLTSS